MDQAELTLRILEELYPDESDIVGPSNLRRLAEGATETIRVDGGSDLDLSEALHTLASAVVVIYGITRIVREFPRPPLAREEVETFVARSIPLPRGMPSAERDAILRRLLALLNQEDGTAGETVRLGEEFSSRRTG